MSISRTEHQALLNSVKSMSKSDGKFLKETLISLADESVWFKDYLFRALKRGLIFSYKNKEENSAASYVFKKNKIQITTSYFDKALPPHILKELFRLILRHEVTHAVDYQDFTSTKKNIADQAEGRIRYYREVVNFLYNNLACLDKTYKLNINILDELSPFLSQPTNISHQITTSGQLGESHSEAFELSRISMANIGCVIDIAEKSPETSSKFMRYVINNWKINDNAHVSLHTLNPVFISERYNLTKSVRDKNNLQSLEKLFNKHFDRKPYEMWEQLTSKQRNTLDMLYMLRTRIHSNIGHDPICFPKFNACLDTPKTNCFNDLYNCQKETDTDSLIITGLEISAVLRERADAYLVDLDTIDNLCILPPPVIPAPKNIQSPIQIGLKSAGVGFVSETAALFMQDRKYNNIVLTQLLICAALLYVISLFNEKDSNADLLSSTLLLLKYGLDQYLSPTAKSRTDNLITGLLIAPQVLTEGPQATLGTLIAGSTGSYIGTTLARSMGNALGWKNGFEIDKAHNTLVNRVNPIVETDRDKFINFLKSIEEKNYSQALRRACTSTDPQAIELIKILFSFKNILAININEPAGTLERTALHHAALVGNQDTYDFLIQNGANQTLRDKDGFISGQYKVEPFLKNKIA